MTNLEQTGYIYAIKNNITNKYYIGQTRLLNPISRWKDHFDSAFLKNENYHLYKSMKKYGISNFTFQIIEEDILLRNLDDREKFYIGYFDSFNNGYNNTLGGQDNDWHSKLTKEQVLEIIDKIKDGTDSFVTIAKQYNVNPSTISDINNGDTWNFDNMKYPIVNKNNKKYFTEEEIQDIYAQLKLGVASRRLAEIYQTSKTTILHINNGKIYKHDNIEYPIHKACNAVKNLEVNQIKNIIHLLQATTLSYTKISEKLSISRKTISNIDNGKGYINILNQLGYNSFPIRK